MVNMCTLIQSVTTSQNLLIPIVIKDVQIVIAFDVWTNANVEIEF